MKMHERKGARERRRGSVRGRGTHVHGLLVSCGVWRTASWRGLAAHGGRAEMYAGGAATASLLEDAGATWTSTRCSCVGEGRRQGGSQRRAGEGCASFFACPSTDEALRRESVPAPHLHRTRLSSQPRGATWRS